MIIKHRMGIVLGCLCSLALVADDWPQWMGPHRDGIWREKGIQRTLSADSVTVRWRTAIGSGYAGPAVAQGRVFVMDRQLADTDPTSGDPFARGRIPGTERVIGLDEKTGAILWAHEYNCAYTVSYASGPRATPVVDSDRVYSLGAEGDLVCLTARKGEVAWSKSFGRDYGVKTPTWGFAGHLLVDGERLIGLVGGEGSLVVAWDKRSGKELWRALDAKEPGYCPVVIYELAGRRQLIVFCPESVNGLNPETGEVYWSFPVKIRSGLTVPMPCQDGDQIFLTTFYNGSLLLDLASGEPREVWRSPKPSEKDTYALHSIMPTPHIVGDYVYGVCSYGQLRCIRKQDGERVWETFAATTGKAERWGNAFLVRHEDRWFLFNEKGELVSARLEPDGYSELGRVSLLEPTNEDPRRPVVWSHPAFANQSVYARNDKEIVCVDLGIK